MTELGRIIGRVADARADVLILMQDDDGRWDDDGGPPFNNEEWAFHMSNAYDLLLQAQRQLEEAYQF